MATAGDIENWLRNEYGSRDFNQLCQALMWQTCNRFGSAPVSYSSANAAWYATPTAGTGAPPAGAHTFWDIGSYGHVGFQLDSSRNEMGTTHTAQDWGWTNRGWQDWATYASITGARFLGWGWSNGANDFPYEGGGSGSVDYAFGLTESCMLALQTAMKKQSPAYYTGPEDGDFGANSVKGMQQWLKDMGYLASNYEVDGIPGPTYGKALQSLARDHGVPKYTGPIDGAPGTQTSNSLQGWAPTTWGTTPPPDPDPELPATPDGTFFTPDLGSSQGTFDFPAFQAGGGIAAILKMGGGNASDSPYVAPQYEKQHTAARALDNFAIGHYWFNGRQNGLTPTTSAQYFVEHMHLEEGDLVALDVETETATNTPRYTAAEAEEFVDEVRRLKPGIVVGLYMNNSDYLAEKAAWDAMQAAGKVWMWVARWGANDGAPHDEPDADWAIWQYSSANPAPGVPGWPSTVSTSLDRNAAKDDVWTRYGYVEDTEPPPEPDELAAVMEAYFQEAAALNTKYRDQVQAIMDLLEPGTESAVPEPEQKHRRWGRWSSE